MIHASDAFHAAVYENSPEERILLRFSDNTFLTNEDIQVSGGVSISEAVNYEEELTLGGCLSSVLEATIINDHRLLSGYTFGDCAVSLGVRTQIMRTEATQGNCSLIIGYGEPGELRVEGFGVEPYLRVNGDPALGDQPPFPVYALLAEGRQIYCIGKDGKTWTAKWLDRHDWQDYEQTPWDDLSGTTWDEMLGGFLIDGKTLELSGFMQRKMRRYAKARRAVALNGAVAHDVSPEGTVKRFEYVPLGVFRMDIPTKRKTDFISVHSYDRMTAFNVDASLFLSSLTFPVTVKQMLHRLCAYVKIPLATIGDFLNSEVTFSQNPIIRSDVTCRDILGWIAQLACTIARMTRYGELELTWFGEQEVTLPMNRYFDIDVTERDVNKIDALQIASASEGIDITVGGAG